MTARNRIFALLASASVGAMATVSFETSLRAEMYARLEPAGAPDARLGLEGGGEQLATEQTFTRKPFKEAVAEFQKAVPMTADEWRRLEDEHRARGFTMARTANMSVLRDAHAAITAGIEAGTPKRDVMKALRDSYTANGEEAPGASYLSLVHDNAVLKAYGQGRWRQVTQPDVMRLRPFAEYYTRHDDRVRPLHRALDGTVAELGSAFWQRWWPPNGHRCRCGVRTLSQAQVTERGLQPVEDAPAQIEVPGYGVVRVVPEPGWGGSPATAQAVEATAAKVAHQVDRAPLLGRDPAGMVRDDAKRAQVVEQLANMDTPAIAEQLRQTPRFEVYGTGEAAEPPAGELRVDWWAYSQNTDGVAQIVTRTVEERGLFRLRDRIGVAPRASFEAAVDVAARPDPELVWSAALAAEVPPPAGRAVGLATEVAVRFAPTAEELPVLQAVLHQNGERRSGADPGGGQLPTPVRYAWPVADAEVWASAPAELPPEDGAWKRAVRNFRRQPDGREVSTLSRAPLPGWDRAVPILVNAARWEALP